MELTSGEQSSASAARDTNASIKALLATGEAADLKTAWAKLRGAITPELDFASQHKLCRLFDKFPKKELGLTPFRLAILSTNTTDHISQALRLHLGAEGLDAEIYSTEFNTIEQNVFDPQSELYKFQPDAIWLFSTYRDASSRNHDQEFERLTNLWSAIRANSSALIVQNNFDLPAWRTFGHYEANVPWSDASFFRNLNQKLAHDAPNDVAVFDFDHVAALFGKRRWVDERYWHHSKHAFNFDALSLVAFHGAKLLASAKGRAKKCLVLDLDNTMWGGIIGDDGLTGISLGQGSASGEAFLAFQEYVMSLKKRGVILAVCSKNEENNAKEPFEKHPEMMVKLDDIAAFVANWQNKADNIRFIAETLDIGLDSIVFADDNPVERNLVRDFLPMVAVPELPEDPSKYVRALDSYCYFETRSFNEEDRARGDMYRQNAERKILRDKVTDVSEYLRSLEMKAVAANFDEFHVPRVSQLINKSNQFHLTTTRYSEAQVQAFADSPDAVGRYYKLRDRFGDNGLIGVIILKHMKDQAVLEIDSWLMSCRVLSRGMEKFMQNDVLQIAQSLGVKTIKGRYIPTSKNKLVMNHYRDLGYRSAGENGTTTFWELDVTPESKPFEVFIEPVTSY